MQTLVALGTFLVVIASTLAETTEGYQKQIRPVAESCKESNKASDADVDSVVHLHKDFSSEAKCLAACVMDKVGIMREGTLTSEAEYLAFYRTFFADDPKRLEKADTTVKHCRNEALEKFPNQTCDMAHAAIICTILKTY